MPEFQDFPKILGTVRILRNFMTFRSKLLGFSKCLEIQGFSGFRRSIELSPRVWRSSRARILPKFRAFRVLIEFLSRVFEVMVSYNVLVLFSEYRVSDAGKLPGIMERQRLA